MSAAETAALVAVPTIIGNVARAMYEDAEGRVMADKEDIPDWDDADPGVWRFWHRMAHVALAAAKLAEAGQ